jgi:hypothetical protein
MILNYLRECNALLPIILLSGYRVVRDLGSEKEKEMESFQVGTWQDDWWVDWQMESRWEHLRIDGYEGYEG